MITEEMEFVYNENGILYKLVVIGSEAQRIVDLLQADNEGRLIILPCNEV